MRAVFGALGLAMLSGNGAMAQDAPREPLPYRMTASVTLPSTDTWWDYVKFQPDTARLFMARLDDGLTVFDVDQGKAIATVDNSTGANGPVLLPRFNRGYVAMDDGSMLSFDLTTLKVIARTKLASDGGLNSGTYDPASGQLHMITGTREAESTWFSIDPATGKLARTTRFPFRKMDDPTADGKGALYAPARMDGIVLKLDSRTLKEQARWNVGCNIAKLKYLPESNRLLGGCKGDKNEMLLIDPANGTVTARVTIGSGLDALVIDSARKRFVSSNYDGSMTVVSHDAPDTLRVVATVRTGFGARMMDIDHRTGRLYLVNSDRTDFPVPGSKEVTVHHPDTFRVETWQPN